MIQLGVFSGQCETSRRFVDRSNPKTHHRHSWQPYGPGEGGGLHAHRGGDVVRGGTGEALEADVLQPVAPGHHDVGDLDTCSTMTQ